MSPLAYYATSPMSILIDDAIHRSKKPRAVLAAEIGINPNMVSMIKRGTHAMPCERVEAFAKALNIPVRTLIEAGIASYPDNQGWRAMGIVMRIRVADLLAA
jgi:ribosome-binding protein aMBF1 (putative translation factor)